MRNEEMIEDLFEAARSETSVRKISQVQEFMDTVDLTGAHPNLIVKWLKQYKMNILLTSSTIIIATTIVLFPKTPTLTKKVELDPVEIAQPEAVASEPQTPVPMDESQEEVTLDLPAQTAVHDQESSTQEVMLDEQSVKKEASSVLDTAAGTTSVLKSTSKTSISSASSSTNLHLPTTEQEEPTQVKAYEHKIVLESKGGRASAVKFKAYLQENMSKLNPELRTSASSDLIRKFTLKLDNGLKANFQMQVTGFTTLELNWNIGADNEVKSVSFRLNDGEISELDFSQESKSSTKVKFTSSDF